MTGVLSPPAAMPASAACISAGTSRAPSVKMPSLVNLTQIAGLIRTGMARRPTGISWTHYHRGLLKTPICRPLGLGCVKIDLCKKMYMFQDSYQLCTVDIGSVMK